MLTSVVSWRSKNEELSEVSTNAQSYPAPENRSWRLDRCNSQMREPGSAGPAHKTKTVHSSNKKKNESKLFHAAVCGFMAVLMKEKTRGARRGRADFHSHNSCLQCDKFTRSHFSSVMLPRWLHWFALPPPPPVLTSFLHNFHCICHLQCTHIVLYLNRQCIFTHYQHQRPN